MKSFDRLLRPFLVLLVGFGLASTSLAQPEQPGAGTTISPGMATWQSARPNQAIFGALLERLGYEVKEPSTLANPIFYQSLVDGELDYWPNGFFPTHRAQFPADFEEKGSVVGTIVERGAVQGYLVSREAVEEYDITSLEDFKRPEVKEAFDANGDGKADLVGCPAGWGCATTIAHHMDVYGLDDHVNLITATYPAAFADALARYRNGEPVAFYTWTPNFTTFELVPGEDVMWINVPDTRPTEAQTGLQDAMVVADLDGAVSNPVKLGFVAADIRVVANSAFLEANPAARALFEEVTLPKSDLSAMTARVVDGEDSAEAVSAMVEEWITEHQELVDGWLQKARDAAQ